MAQQFLNGAQIGSGGQKVSGVGVAQGVRSYGFGQADFEADFLHLALDDPRAQTFAPGSQKHGIAGLLAVGAFGQIIINGIDHSRQ